MIRITDVTGSTVGSDADAREPSVAYNPNDGQFLAVWRADTRVDNQAEVFGQLLDAAGNAIGGEIQIATMRGGDDAADPDVAYNPDRKEYMVVWQHVSTTDLDDVWGQRVAADGRLAGGSIQISNLSFGTSATSPSVVYNSSSYREYLVVWNSNEGALTGQGSTQVWGQRLSDIGGVVGGDFQISNLGDGSSVAIPDVTYNSITNQYMVVWSGDLTIPSETNKEVYGQLLNANGGEAGPEFQITNVTGDDDNALSPRVACNSSDNEYLVVYSLANDDEIFGQRFDSSGSEIGATDFQISDKAAVGSPGFTRPNLIHNPTENEYVVVWRETTGVIDTFGQAVRSDGTLVESQTMISDVQGGTAETNRDVGDTTVLAYNGDDNEYLAVWRADGPPSHAKDTVDEIFAQRLTVYDPTTRWVGPPGSPADWFDAGNWTKGPPDPDINAYIDGDGWAVIGMFGPDVGEANAVHIGTIDAGRLTIADGGLDADQIHIGPGGIMSSTKPIANLPGRTIALHGGTLDAPLVVNAHGALIGGHGDIIVEKGSLANYGDAGFDGTTWIYGSLYNDSNANLAIEGGDLYVTDDSLNEGHIGARNGLAHFGGGLVSNGTLDVEVAIAVVSGDFSVGAGGVVRLDADSTLQLRNDFNNASTQNVAFDMLPGTLQFHGRDTQVLEAAGADLGADARGWIDNFAIGELRLDPGVRIILTDVFDNRLDGNDNEAVYVDELTLAGGAWIDLNDRSLYYHNGGPAKLLHYGDFDLNGRVDRTDFHILQAGFGTTGGAGWIEGDTDGDGDVDFLDYLHWKSCVGWSSPGLTPEPAALLLLGPGVAVLLRRRKV